MSAPTTSLSIGRIVTVLVPTCILAFAGSYLLSSKYEQTAREKIQSNMLSRLLGPVAPGPKEPIKFVDSDGDLLADSPETDLPPPEKLVFSYVASADPGEEQQAWTDLVTAIGEATGIPVEYRHYSSTIQQLTAMAAGELHVAGLNTGSVPVAVKSSGFIPVCTFGDSEGNFGYKMKIVSPASGSVKAPEDLKGERVTFVRPDSNSGCKAALVLLMDKYQLLPERDYEWAFSMGHDTSIRGVAAGEIVAAPIASDILDRMTSAGLIDSETFNVIYESERFPPAALGMVYNLPQEVREKIRTTMVEFNWRDSSVAASYQTDSVTQFVPVNYKDDWANIRRVDAAVKKAR